MAKGIEQARRILNSSQEKAQKEINTKLIAKLVLAEKYKALYSAIQVGEYVLARGRTGLVVDKFINVGGIPQLWIVWGICKTPYPECPSPQGNWAVERVACCLLSEAPQVQREAA